MKWFGGDPGIPVLVDGKETFPLVPVAIGLYSTVFNIFNTLLLFPFIGVFDRVLSRIGRTASEDIEDYSVPKYLRRDLVGDLEGLGSATAAGTLSRGQGRAADARRSFAGVQPNAPERPAATEKRERT